MNRILLIIFILSCLFTHKAETQSFSEIIRNIQSDSDTPQEPDEGMDDTDQVDLDAGNDLNEDHPNNEDDPNEDHVDNNVNTVDSDTSDDLDADVTEDTPDQNLPDASTNIDDVDTDVGNEKVDSPNIESMNDNQKPSYVDETLPPEDIRASSESRFSVGGLLGVNYNFMGANCYDISSKNTCYLITNRESGGDEWINPEEIPDDIDDIIKLKARGFGMLINGFIDWSANDTLGIRITYGWEHFSVIDTVGSSVAAVDRLTTLVDCSTKLNPDGMRVAGDAGGRSVCYAYIDYISLSGLIRYKMDVYEDLNPWIGAGMAILIPFDWKSEFLNKNEIPPVRGAFHVAMGLDINISNNPWFFPATASFTYPFNNFLKDSTPKAIEDYSIALSVGVGYRF